MGCPGCRRQTALDASERAPATPSHQGPGRGPARGLCALRAPGLRLPGDPTHFLKGTLPGLGRGGRGTPEPPWLSGPLLRSPTGQTGPALQVTVERRWPLRRGAARNCGSRRGPGGLVRPPISERWPPLGGDATPAGMGVSPAEAPRQDQALAGCPFQANCRGLSARGPGKARGPDSRAATGADGYGPPSTSLSPWPCTPTRGRSRKPAAAIPPTWGDRRLSRRGRTAGQGHSGAPRSGL